MSEAGALISARTRTCLLAFEQCLSNVHTVLSVRQYSNVEDQMARFSIWASNMAVFSVGKACLDHRLREANDVHRLVLGMLEALKTRISECETHVSLLPVEQDQSPKTSLTHWNDGFDKILGALASQVGLFHEVSNVIRKSSRQSQNNTAEASFCIKDQEGTDLEPILKHFFYENLRDRFPESSPSIHERLSAAMILRRKRILYRRARYWTRPIKPPQPVAKPVVMPRPAPSQLLQHEESKKSNPSLPKMEPTLATSQIQSTTKSATTLDPERFLIASAPSAVSSTRYTDIDAHEDLVFPPPPPALKNHSMEVTCPYCLYALPSREFQSVARWRKHVLADLDPLVCLFDRCDRPEILYSHTKDWLRHMRKHTEHWRCTAKSHGLLKFATFEEFLLHMKIGHGKNYTKSQTGLLSEKKTQANGPLFECCPLCGGIPEEKGDGTHNGMIGHIVGHLRSLALKSLPPIHLDGDDAFPEDEDDSRPSRSTIKDSGSDHDSSFGLAPSLNDDNEKEFQEEEIPLANEFASEQIWSAVWSKVQPEKHLPIFGSGDDPIIMAMLLYQSKEQAFEIPEVPEQKDLHAVPTGLAPYISPAYHSESVGQSELSEEEMRLRLTDYKCVRFEKPIGQSTWENVVRTNDQGISKSAIINEIRRLEAETQDLVQKQASLPPALSRYLDMDLEALNRNDLNRNLFMWTLAQIDQQAQEIGSDAAIQRGGKLVQDQGQTPEATATQQGKTYWQRASVTAYFKRSLKPGRTAGFWYSIVWPALVKQEDRPQVLPHDDSSGNSSPHRDDYTASPHSRTQQSRTSLFDQYDLVARRGALAQRLRALRSEVPSAGSNPDHSLDGPLPRWRDTSGSANPPIRRSVLVDEDEPVNAPTDHSRSPARISSDADSSRPGDEDDRHGSPSGKQLTR